ncbi:hypothetical protein BDW74DRAFT_182043 [Aspergillus multicolor]|uniref:uncharacterized protein n=1 Tax=Aspergillus multicolor TaxID=41759 RepID=UPI003CCCCADB
MDVGILLVTGKGRGDTPSVPSARGGTIFHSINPPSSTLEHRTPFSDLPHASHGTCPLQFLTRCISSPMRPPSGPTSTSKVVQKATTDTIFRYRGPSGVLRASQRPRNPARHGERCRTIMWGRSSGEVVRLEVQLWLWPTEMVFEAGDQPVLKINGRKVGLDEGALLEKETEAELNPNPNRSKHVLHLAGGGEMESRLDISTLDVWI